VTQGFPKHLNVACQQKPGKLARDIGSSLQDPGPDAPAPVAANKHV